MKKFALYCLFASIFCKIYPQTPVDTGLNTTIVAPQVTTTEKKISLGVWAGANASVITTDYTRAVDMAYFWGAEKTTLLPAFGLNAWYGDNRNQFGATLGYIPVFSYTAQGTFQGNNTFTESIRLLTLQVAIRHFIVRIPGVYVGAALGSGAGIVTANQGSGSVTVLHAILPLTLKIGYEYAFDKEFSVGLNTDVSFVFQKFNQQFGTAASATYAHNTLNITPGIFLNYRFN